VSNRLTFINPVPSGRAEGKSGKQKKSLRRINTWRVSRELNMFAMRLSLKLFELRLESRNILPA
jgi:hypothetical protein